MTNYNSVSTGLILLAPTVYFLDRTVGRQIYVVIKNGYFTPPPGSEKYLKDNRGNLVYNVTSPEVYNVKKSPHFDKAPQPLAVHKKEGEIISVPRYAILC